MQRLLKGRTGEITASFADSSPVPTKATVSIKNDAGTVVASGSATVVAGVCTFSVPVSATGSLDRLTATWTAGEETQTTYADVSAAHLTSLDEISADVPSGTSPTEAELKEARILAEEALEDACYVSFVPRFRREVLDTPALRRGRLRTLRELKVNGSAVASVSSVRVVDQRYITKSQFFGNFYGGITQVLPPSMTPQIVEVAYEHGWDEPPPLVARAVARLAAFFLTEDPSDYDQRATSISTEQAHYTLITPGLAGAVFALPEANAIVQRYGLGSGYA